MSSKAKIPTVKFDSKITEVTRRLTAAFESSKLIIPSYGIWPDKEFAFDAETFEEFTRQVCEEHYGRIYSRKGIQKTFRDNVKGDFLAAIIGALEKNESSGRLKLLVIELRKLS